MKRYKPIKVAIADDHSLLRKGIIEILSGFNDIALILDAGNGRELLEKIAESPEKPEVCILDINMPVMNGYDTAKALLQKHPKMKVLALSMYDNELNIIKMLRSGAHGYVLKDIEPAQLREAIISTYEEGYYFTNMVTPDLLRASKSADAKKEEAILTSKEITILKYCCSDLTYKEIAEQMGISSRTVESYRDGLFEKLNVRSRTGLALYAVKTGIFPLYE